MNNRLNIIRHLKKYFRIVNERVSELFKGTIKISESSYPELILNTSKISYSAAHINYSYQGDTPYWLHFKNIKLRPLRSVSLEATVIGRGIILNSKNEVLLESTIGQQEYLDKLGSNHLVFFKFLLPTQKITRAISLSNRLEHNYYHWILESIGRLIFLPEKSIKKYVIIVNSRSQSFVTDSLVQLIGIQKDNIVYKKEFSKINVKEVLIPSFPVTRNEETRMTNIYHPAIFTMINKRAQKIVRTTKKRNIIISRENATQRRIHNRELIEESFPHLNFEIISLEKLSFIDQLNLFANAGVVIGVHGAGLVNLVFGSSPIIVELFPSSRNKRDSFYFYQISQELKFEHHVIEYEESNMHQDVTITVNLVKKIEKIFRA